MVFNRPDRSYSLPQVFIERTLTKFVGSRVEKEDRFRHYLGDDSTVQYLEDCGLLEDLLLPSDAKLKQVLCSEWRVHNGLAMFRKGNSKLDEHLNLIRMQPAVEIKGNW